MKVECETALKWESSYKKLHGHYKSLKLEKEKLAKQVQKNGLSLLRNKSTKKEDHTKCKEIIEQLKKDLAHAQRSILEMTNVVGVKQTLPTVQETLSQFHSIRDQQHHNTSTALKTYINTYNQQKGEKWQKYYVNQVVHRIMFNVIIKCYVRVSQYKQDMFQHIADELNMTQTIKTSLNEKQGDDEDNKNDDNEDKQQQIAEEIKKILSNRFGSYFKDNYKTILKMHIVRDEVRDEILMQEYSECLKDIAQGDTLESLNEYIVQCCEICWIMILQDPPLELQPIEWESEEKIKFEDKKHKRVLGSDRRCKSILYHVWPVIARNGSILDDQKMDVVLKDNMYNPQKGEN